MVQQNLNSYLNPSCPILQNQTNQCVAIDDKVTTTNGKKMTSTVYLIDPLTKLHPNKTFISRIVHGVLGLI